MSGAAAGCPLCEADGGLLLVRHAHWRLVRADEPGFPAFYRVVWNEHAREFSDLSAPQRTECMEAVVAVETLLREHLQPTKVNLATLGNAVPHLHWHVIARFDWDSHFPGAVWAGAQRQPAAEHLAEVLARRPALEQALVSRLG